MGNVFTFFAEKARSNRNIFYTDHSSLEIGLGKLLETFELESTDTDEQKIAKSKMLFDEIFQVYRIDVVSLHIVLNLFVKTMSGYGSVDTSFSMRGW